MYKRVKAECKDCKGTGLIVKKHGDGTVCSSCKGEGGVFITYKEFSWRKRNKLVSRVQTLTRMTGKDKKVHDHVNYMGINEFEKRFPGME